MKKDMKQLQEDLQKVTEEVSGPSNNTTPNSKKKK